MGKTFVSNIANLGMTSNMKGVGGGAKLKEYDPQTNAKESFLEKMENDKDLYLNRMRGNYTDPGTADYYINQGVADSQAGQCVAPPAHTTDKEFTVRDIPDVMRGKLGWPKSAELMELWFSKPAKEMTLSEKEGDSPYDSNYTDTGLFSLAWLERFERAKKGKSALVSSEVLWSDNAKLEIIDIVMKSGKKIIDNSALDIISLHDDWQFQLARVGYDFGVVDDLYGSLGNFAFYAAIHKAYVEEIESEKYIFVTEIAIYMKDTFDFIGSQYLGHWNEHGMGINVLGGALNGAQMEWAMPGWNYTLGIAEAFGNSEFRDYRAGFAKGGDLLLFSDKETTRVYEKIKVS
ncbi:DUF6402 family protein [Enterovibrio sp. Hal110]